MNPIIIALRAAYPPAPLSPEARDRIRQRLAILNTRKDPPMETLHFTDSTGRPHDIPIALGFGLDNEIITDLAGDIAPEHCNHAGQCWSSDLVMRCRRCGIRLFLPTRLLACRSDDQITTMHALWVRAGWPHWSGSAWSIKPQHWTIVQHPLFTHTGGLPIRNDRLADFPTI